MGKKATEPGEGLGLNPGPEMQKRQELYPFQPQPPALHHRRSVLSMPVISKLEINYEIVQIRRAVLLTVTKGTHTIAQGMFYSEPLR